MKPAVARIALSYEACELAELARNAVPTGRSTTEAVADAGRILQAAQRFLAAAVVAAEADGVPWPTITELLSAGPSLSNWRAHLLLDPHEAATPKKTPAQPRFPRSCGNRKFLPARTGPELG